MASTLFDSMEYLAGDSLPYLRATTRRLAALYPFMLECGLIDPVTGLKIPGVPIGTCGLDGVGGLYDFDEVQLFQHEVAENTNVLVLGKIGRGKSGFLKSQIYRGTPFGYCFLVTDPKGEYTPLAKAIPGSKVIRFGDGSNAFINPLGKDIGDTDKIELLKTMALIAMPSRSETGLTMIEESLLSEVLADLHRSFTSEDNEPTLPDFVEKLFHPTDDIAKGMGRSKEFLSDRGYDLALALRQYTTGTKKGMFHKQTTVDLFEETPLLVLNLEGVHGDATVVMIMLINFIIESHLNRKDRRHRLLKIYHDEAWDLASYKGFVDSVRRMFKLGGTLGLCNWVVAHHLSNFERSSPIDAIKDLVADSGIKIFYKQNEKELRDSAQVLGITEREIQEIIKLPKGVAIHKIGDRPGIRVNHIRWPEEFELLQTRRRLLGEDEPEEDEEDGEDEAA